MKIIFCLFAMLGAGMAHAQLIQMNGIYRFEENTELLPLDDDQTITFSKNEPVAVKFLGEGFVKIGILLSEEEVGIIPESIVILHDQFAASNLVRIENGSFRDLTERYSPDAEVEVAARGFVRRGRMHYRNSAGGSYYGCVAYVCRAIGGCVGRTGNGRGMTNYLRNRGWRPVSCSNPQKGTVASWTGGSHGLGHTAIWNGSGWCYDKGCHDPGRKYRLSNCVAR